MNSDEEFAAMKLNIIKNRGSKKDFYDLYELLKHYTLEQIINFHDQKYEFNSKLIILKSLLYFEDANEEPDPISTEKLNWNDVKHLIEEKVHQYST